MYTFVFVHLSFCTLYFLYTFCFCTLVAGRQLPSGSNFGSWSPLQMWQGPLTVLHYTVFCLISLYFTTQNFAVFHCISIYLIWLCSTSLHSLYFTHTPLLLHIHLREGFKKKKREKVWSFAKPGAGGVSGGGEKTKLLF